jgi:anti-sigma B factor antagonist
MGDQPTFSVHVRFLDPHRPVVEVHGDVDLATAPELVACMTAALARDPVDLIVDMTNTTFFDCSGISVLVAARNRLSDDAQLILRRPRPFIRQVLRLLRLDMDCVMVD